MIGHICSLTESSGAAAPSGSSAQQDRRTKSASLDDDLIALCRQFRCKLDEWVEQVRNLSIENYNEPEETGRALHALRVEWGNCLETLRALEPSTVLSCTEN